MRTAPRQGPGRPARRRAVQALGILVIAGPLHAEDPRIALLEAVRRDDGATVTALLARGVSPDTREKTNGPAIVMAAALGSWRALAALAQAPHIDLEAVDAKGQSALMLAALAGHLPSVEQLLGRGAKVDGTSPWTALHYAAAQGRTEVARTLVLHGANLDARSANGTTPAMLAARQNNMTTLELLAGFGADLDARNERGWSVANYLEAQGEAGREAGLRALSPRNAR